VRGAAAVVQIGFTELLHEPPLEPAAAPQIREEEVPHATQQGLPHQGHSGQDPGIAQHLITNTAAFLGVGLQQLRPGLVLKHQGELPRQVEGVLHAGVHALPTGWAVDVGRITGQEDTANALTVDLALIDPEVAQPDRIVGAIAGSQPLLHQALDLLERWIRSLRSRDIANDAEAIHVDWKQGQDPIGIPNHRHLIGGCGAVELHVRQDPVRFQGFTAEGQTEAVAHHAVGAITAQQIAALHRLLAAVSPAELRADSALGLRKIGELDLAFNLHATLRQQLGQHRLGAVLGNHQGVRERAVNLGEGQLHQHVPSRLDPSTMALNPRPQEGLDTAVEIQQFQGPRSDHHGLGELTGLGCPVHHAYGDALLMQGQSQGEAHRACSHNQDGV